MSRGEDLDLEPGARLKQHQKCAQKILSISTMGRERYTIRPPAPNTLTDGLFARDTAVTRPFSYDEPRVKILLSKP